MAAPNELTVSVLEVGMDKTVPKNSRLAVLNKVLDWAESACPWVKGDRCNVAGLSCVLVDVQAKFQRVDGKQSLIWMAVVERPDGSSFTVSELSMPTVENPQN